MDEELELRRKLLMKELGHIKVDPDQFNMLLERQKQFTPIEQVRENLGVQDKNPSQPQSMAAPQDQEQPAEPRKSKYGRPLIGDTNYEEGTSVHQPASDTPDPFVAPWQAFQQRTRRKPTPDEARAEFQMLSAERQQFEGFKQQLTQNFGRMDPVARSYYNDMQKRSMAIEKAYQSGKLRPIEYFRGIKELSDRAQTVLWDKHFTAPGSQPGDIVVQEGIRSIRQKDGSLEHVGYTQEYVRANTKRLPNGKMLVPVSPGKPDIEVEDKRSIEANKLFEEQWDKAGKSFEEVNGRQPGFNPATNQIGDTPELRKEMENFRKRVRASTKDMYVERELFRKELDDQMNAAESGQPISALEQVAQEEAAENQKELQTKLTDHVTKAYSQAKNVQQIGALMQGSEGQMPEGKLSSKQKADNWFKDPATMAAASNPVPVRTSQEIARVPDGKVIMGRNGQRYLKLEGKLYPIKWDEVMQMREKGPMQNAPQLSDQRSIGG